jgi:hypothetical protein
MGQARSAGGPSAPTSNPVRSSGRRSLAGCLIVVSLSFAGAAFAAASRWSIEPTVVPAGARASVLSAVSCPSPTGCTAVGYVTDRTGAGVTLSERRSGPHWSVARTPARPGARANLLFGVSCPATTACTAVGSAVGRSGRSRPLAERWDGSRWSVQPTPAVSGAAGYLAGVSCASVAACVAVGYTGERAGSAGVALAERWDGHRWRIERTVRPIGAQASFLSGVSCTGPRACTAVGFANGTGGTQAPIAERYNGRRWRLQSMIRAPGQLDTQLAGVACAGERSCTAVGFFTNATGIDVMLAEHWNGIRWAQQKPQYPRGARYVQFSGVSCPSSRSCTAVGLYNDVQGADAILVERSHGDRWTIERTPGPAGTISRSLSGVACSSANTCTAVGSSTNLAGAGRTLAARAS